MIVDSLPDIPRFATGIAEWAACLVYILLMRPRLGRWALGFVCVAALPVLIGVQLLVAEPAHRAVDARHDHVRGHHVRLHLRHGQGASRRGG
ncbi:hypothetical protein [Demequina litorisediminis]|uniref:Uncharacterized protein n=1 Tax=Demequina litorisediminis TaxID=1849022 RepID=A0ABQ6IBN0_9MICO|nr:hypothetical protein [Demequina litorisediminis]GMA34755.1 hypothetical protein GCM10025876_09590 [Demequina litorisediminis]